MHENDNDDEFNSREDDLIENNDADEEDNNNNMSNNKSKLLIDKLERGDEEEGEEEEGFVDDDIDGVDDDEDDAENRQNISKKQNKLKIKINFYNNKKQQSQHHSTYQHKELSNNKTQETKAIATKAAINVPNTDNHYERQYSCKFCSYFTNNPRAILYHRKSYHNEKIPIYECKYCQYASQYSGKVERHTLLRHKIDIANSTTTATSTSNQLANQQTQQQDELDNNNNNNASQQLESQITFQCDKCPCKYKRSNDLYKHLRLKHGSSSSTTAATVAATSNDDSIINDSSLLSSSSPIIMTTQSANGESLKLECPYCTYTTTNLDYIQHVKEHLGGKTFRCVLCNAIYKYRGDCVVHLKRKHQKSDLIAQNYVQRISIDEMNVSDVYSMLKPKMYDDIDNDDKLFGCFYCDYKANYKGDVYKHQTRRHPGTDKNVRILNQAAANANTSADDENESEFPKHQKQHKQPNQQQKQQQNLIINYSDDIDDEVDGGGLNGVGTIDDYQYHNNHHYVDDEDEDDENDYDEENDMHEDDDEDGDDFEREEDSFDTYNTSAAAVTSSPAANDSLMLYECKLCPYKAKNSAKLQFHMSTHENLKPYMCPICKKRANFKWDIQKHLRKVHMNLHDEVVCLSPNEARETINEYIEYYGNGANSNVKRFSNNGSSHYNGIQQDDDYHTSNNNNNNSNHLPSLLLNPNMVGAGVGGKHSARERKYKCSLCNRTSKWQWDIRKHLRTVHKEAIGDVVVINDKALIKKLTENPSYSRTLALMNPDSPPVSHHQQIVTNNESMASPPQSTHQQQIASSLHSNYVSIGSDSTGNKKFKCTICPYRSNWKADLFRHIRKRHGVVQPSIDDVIILTPEEAAMSIGDYEQTHGIYIRKRSRIDLETNSCSNTTTNSSSLLVQSQNENENMTTSMSVDSTLLINDNSVIVKRPRILLPANDNHQEEEGREEEEEEDEEDEENDNNKDSISIKREIEDRILMKTFQCLKCTYKTIRKSDLSRHLKVRHSLYTNLSRYFKTHQNNSQQHQQQQQQQKGDTFTTFNNHSSHKNNQKIIFNKNFYKCQFCLFKHVNKAMVKKHLLTHQLKTNGFKCNICSYKSEWRYSVKKHIISTHWLVPNAAVVKCVLKPSSSSSSSSSSNSNASNNYKHVTNGGDNKNNIITASSSSTVLSSDQIKTETMDLNEQKQQQNENNNKNNENELNYTIKSENDDEVEDEDEQLKQQIAAVKPSSFESSKLITPNGKSYKSAFVPVTSNGTVISDVNSVDYANCTKKKMYFCESCPYKTNNYCNLKQHLLQHRPEAGHAKCRYCPYYVSMSRLLKQHEILHPEYIPRERDINNTSSNSSLNISTSNSNINNNSSPTTTTTAAVQSSPQPFLVTSSQNNETSTNIIDKNDNNNESLSQSPHKSTTTIKQQESSQFKIYRCKYCSFTSKDVSEAKAHGISHIIQQQKQNAAAAALSYKPNKPPPPPPSSTASTASASSSSSSPSPSPSSIQQQQHQQQNTSRQQQQTNRK